MKIKTNHLVLREIEETDINDLASIANEPSISYFVGKMPYPFTIDEAKELVRRAKEKKERKPRLDFDLSIYSTRFDKLVGMINLFRLDNESKKAGLGFWLGLPYRKQGIMSEALGTILATCFGELELNKVYCTCLKDNKASIHILKKFGFRKVGVFKEDRIKTCKELGIFEKKVDVISWELLKRDYSN